MQQSAAPFVEGLGRKALAPRPAPAGLPEHPLDPCSPLEYEQASVDQTTGEDPNSCQCPPARSAAAILAPPETPACPGRRLAPQVAQACREHAASLGLDPAVLRFNGVNAQVNAPTWEAGAGSYPAARHAQGASTPCSSASAAWRYGHLSTTSL